MNNKRLLPLPPAHKAAILSLVNSSLNLQLSSFDEVLLIKSLPEVRDLIDSYIDENDLTANVIPEILSDTLLTKELWTQFVSEKHELTRIRQEHTRRLDNLLKKQNLERENEEKWFHDKVRSSQSLISRILSIQVEDLDVKVRASLLLEKNPKTRLALKQSEVLKKKKLGIKLLCEGNTDPKSETWAKFFLAGRS